MFFFHSHLLIFFYFYLFQMKIRLIILLSCAFICGIPVAGQSNYASHGNNVEYQGEGLPEKTVLDGKVIKLDDLSPLIFLNRTKATLNCVAGSMQVRQIFIIHM